MLRLCTDADENFLRILHRRCYHDVVVAQLGSWEDGVQRSFFDKKWNPSHYEIIVLNGRDVGAMSRSCKSDYTLLSEIQIDPDFQNQGLGTRIVRDIVETAQSQGRTVRLQVLRKNKARIFYERLGFNKIGETDTHIIMEM